MELISIFILETVTETALYFIWNNKCMQSFRGKIFCTIFGFNLTSIFFSKNNRNNIWLYACSFIIEHVDSNISPLTGSRESTHMIFPLCSNIRGSWTKASSSSASHFFFHSLTKTSQAKQILFQNEEKLFCVEASCSLSVCLSFMLRRKRGRGMM